MILQKLKEQTSAQHIALEESKLLSHFGNKTIDLTIYKAILKKFYGFFLPMEERLDSFLQLPFFLPDYPSRRKSSTLAADLRHLGINPNDLPICTALPQLADLAQAFGCLYVLEGSTLGGRVITKILHEALQIDERSGASYFNGYGAFTGDKWKLFCQTLLQYGEQGGKEEAMIEGANATFSTLTKWLNDN